ncbi:unnamed protein product, partial [Adineta steineri]
SHTQVFAGFGHQSSTDSSNTIRRYQTGNRLSVMANAKRVYDEALMVKKVKTYLNNAEIIEDENRLLEIANQCEPVGGGNSPISPSTLLTGLTLFSDENEFVVLSMPSSPSGSDGTNTGLDDDKISTIIEDEQSTNNLSSRLRQNSTASPFNVFKTALLNVSTLKRRPSPSTSSLSSNSSSDRRGGAIQLTKFGTQSPDAVNKLLRLSDSSHQIKNRTPQRSQHIPTSSSLSSSTSNNNPGSPLLSTSTTTTGLSSLTEVSYRQNHHHHQHLNKMRDTNKLTSESSSLNFKQPTSYSHMIRSHTLIPQNNNELIKEGGDSGRGSLNSTDTCVGDGSEKSSSTIGEGFASIRVRNRPPLPQSTSVTSTIHPDSAPSPKTKRQWLQRSQSHNEVTTNDGPNQEDSTVDFDEHEQVTAV